MNCTVHNKNELRVVPRQRRYILWTRRQWSFWSKAPLSPGGYIATLHCHICQGTESQSSLCTAVCCCRWAGDQLWQRGELHTSTTSKHRWFSPKAHILQAALGASAQLPWSNVGCRAWRQRNVRHYSKGILLAPHGEQRILIGREIRRLSAQFSSIKIAKAAFYSSPPVSRLKLLQCEFWTFRLKTALGKLYPLLKMGLYSKMIRVILTKMPMEAQNFYCLHSYVDNFLRDPKIYI